MRTPTKTLQISLVSAFLAMASAYAAEAPVLSESFLSLNLSASEKPSPITIAITREQSLAYGWKPGQKIRVTAFVEKKNGRREYLRDAQGRNFWNAQLNLQYKAVVKIQPADSVFSGELLIRGNGKPLGTCHIEEYYEYRFPDEAAIRVRFTDQMMEQGNEDPLFAKEALDAAVMAYQTITQFEGFNTPGYSFASADPQYAYDPDKTIDVFLGHPANVYGFTHRGFAGASFKDAPCFDTVRVSETGFHASILLPSNYKEFIKNWERINPSPLGERNIGVDLRGTLIHEMLHAIIFYYNKNLNKDLTGGHGTGKNLDWYVEGLARYFETFAGAKHDFYSKGFKQTLPDKIRFSRGGSNYFMCYPDQAFTELRYENALFWRFIDYKFGMKAIEALSRDFRGTNREDFKAALEKITGLPFAELLKQFAAAILLKDFGLKEESVYLTDIARTRLVYRKSGFYLKDGFGNEKKLGWTCATDWIGQWDGRTAKMGEMPAAGDNTDRSDVSGWATDFYEIELEPSDPSLPQFRLVHTEDGAKLEAQIFVYSKGGSIFTRQIASVEGLSSEKGIDLDAEISKEGLDAASIDRIYLLVTNMDPVRAAQYEIKLA